ncbi:hypothetical protein ABK91_17545, partial [Salmonella enterica subsp. enterica serovar Montevideo]|uniref:hypothetical protein n=1 Tax=Salmonella enterica TaxID=28901 RepID=UPI001E58F859
MVPGKRNAPSGNEQQERCWPFTVRANCCLKKGKNMTKLTCFKAYDIRGRLGEELNEDIAWR